MPRSFEDKYRMMYYFANFTFDGDFFALQFAFKNPVNRRRANQAAVHVEIQKSALFELRYFSRLSNQIKSNQLCLTRVAHNSLATDKPVALEFPIELEFGSVGFCGGRKTGEPGEKPSEQGREPTSNSTHI